MTLLKDILLLQLPHIGQLSLVTSVLGASASWYTHSLISETLAAGSTVCLLSFTHDKSFHQDSLRKMGVDLVQSATRGQYTFIDGFSTLFFAPQDGVPSLSLVQGCLKTLAAEVQSRIQRMVGERRLLVIEHPELLLASAGVSAVELVETMLDWHAAVSSSVVIASADSNLVARNRTRIEMEHSAFVMTLVHEAATTVNLRMLDTGLAKDVSGVLRLTQNWTNTPSDARRTDMEALYLVKDNSVDVFGRGEQRG